MPRAAIFLLTWLAAASVSAQVVPGRIIGVVTDESNAVLAGVSATLTSPTALPGGPVTVVTNAQGEYRFGGLEPGTYKLTISLSGFRSYEEQDLRVTVGGTTERNLQLKVAAVSETVTVSGQAPVIDPRQTGIAQALPAEVVENIPHKRYGIQSFMATMPGVTTSNYNSPFNVYVMGSNANETSFLFDGVMSNHPSTGNAWTLSDFDGLEEVNVVTLGASAEFQQAQGGVLNAVGKSGTNNFHGDVSAFWGPDSLSTQPIQLACNCPDGTTGFHWLKYRDVSGHMGGPVVKNRAWFFGGEVFRGSLTSTPGQAPPAPGDRYLVWLEDFNSKGTVKLNDSMTFRQTYYHERFWEPLPHAPTLVIPLEAIQLSMGYLPQAGSELTATLNSSTVLTARYALTNFPDKRLGYRESLTTPIHNDSVTGVQTGNTLAYKSHPRRDEVDVKVSKYVSGKRMNQNLSFGAQFVKNSYVEYDVVPGGVQFNDANGLPDQATFSGPSTLAASYNGQGIWGENELNFGHRVTVRLGARFDRMVGISQDVSAVDSQFNETAQTVTGLGTMFTWNKFSPRGGVNIKLTRDDKTVLRGSIGRYYRAIVPNDFVSVYPGVATSTLARFNPAACPGATVATETGSCFSTIISVTDPRANLRVDSNMDAPYTDQYSIGLDREIVRNVGLSATYVRKNAKNLIGWKDIGGVYGTSTASVSVFGQPQTLTVYPLLNATGARIFQRTNGPGFFSQYDGLILNLTRRYANRWMATVGYTYSRTYGLQPGGTLGRDPNDLTNLTGRIDPQDRPHQFNLFGSYEIPRIELQVSGQLAAVSGTPYAPQVLVRLAQGNRSINVDVPGSYRTPSEEYLQFRVTKILFRTGSRRAELTAEIRNALQELDSRSLITRNVASSDFGKPASWPDPRQMLLLGKIFF